MNPHNEYFAPSSETLFPKDFKNEDIPNAITCMRKSNNFMQSNWSSPFLKFSSINSINFPVAAIWRVRQSKRPFLLGRKVSCPEIGLHLKTDKQMEEKARAKSKPSQFFSTKQKHTIIQAFLAGNRPKQQVWKEFTGEVKEKGKILKFMRQLGYIENSVKKKPISFYMDEKPKTSPPVELPEKDAQSAEIKQLKLQLKDSQLREQSYLLMIEIAERDLKINIRKKSYTK
jgi:hypothetical protein